MRAIHKRLGPAPARQRGYTLTELMVATGVFSLLVLGAVGLYIAAMRLCVSLTGSSSASMDAANAIQRVTNDVREAQDFELMDGTGPVDSVAFGTMYNAADANGHTVVSGVRIFAPGPFAYPTGDPLYAQPLRVQTSTTRTVALGGTDIPWNHGQRGAVLDIYRADWHKTGVADGTADPAAGNCLWARGTERGNAVNGPIIRSIAPTVDAVQFIQPYDASAGTPLSNQIKIKITCAAYDPYHGTTSSDSGNGGVSQITGECAYLRDHNPAPLNANSTDANGRSQYGGS